MNTAIKLIIEKLKYRPVGSDYGRIGAMVKRYGEDAVISAINEISGFSFIPDNPIDMIEKQSQRFTKPDKDIETELSKILDE